MAAMAQYYSGRGGIENVSRSEMPRGSDQMCYLAKSIPSRVKTGAGRKKKTAVEELGNLVRGGTFARHFCFGDTVAVICATDRMLEFAKRLLKESVELVFVDMTYNISHEAYVVIISARNTLFQSKRGGKAPILPMAMCCCIGKSEEDYCVFARELKRLVVAKDSQCFRGWMSDGEMALINGFQKVSIFAHPSIHLLCETHLKDNVNDAMKRMGFSETHQETILRQIFGSEIARADGRDRDPGLVDCETEERFYQCLSGLSEEWNRYEFSDAGTENKFSDWMVEHKVSQLLNNYLAPVRRAAGFGDPPGRATNNISEWMNKEVKKDLNRQEYSLAEVIPMLERFFNRRYDLLKGQCFMIVGTGVLRKIPRGEFQGKTVESGAFNLEEFFLNFRNP